MDYKATYEKKYGIAEKMLLRELGGDLDTVISQYRDAQSPVFGGLFADFDCGGDDADHIHNMVTREIESRYFSLVTRDAAVAVCNTLSIGLGFGTIRISDSTGLEYNAIGFMQAWNANHPDEEKIYAPYGIEI